MKPIRKRLEDVRKTIGLPWEIIEKDYILSWVLAGIAANKLLKDVNLKMLGFHARMLSLIKYY